MKIKELRLTTHNTKINQNQFDIVFYQLINHIKETAWNKVFHQCYFPLHEVFIREIRLLFKSEWSNLKK